MPAYIIITMLRYYIMLLCTLVEVAGAPLAIVIIKYIFFIIHLCIKITQPSLNTSRTETPPFACSREFTIYRKRFDPRKKLIALTCREVYHTTHKGRW